MVALDLDGIRPAPDFFSVRQRQAADRVGVVFHVVIEQVDLAVEHCGRRVSIADRQRPQHFRTVRSPVRCEAYVGLYIVHTRSAERWPYSGDIRRHAVEGLKRARKIDLRRAALEVRRQAVHARDFRVYLEERIAT